MEVVKHFKKWLLGIFVTTIPVVIAACYGVPYDISGRVIDADTQEGIDGIEVTCINYDNFSTLEDEGEELVTYTSSGYYDYMATSTGSCKMIKLRDVDGTDNGLYMKKTVFVSDHAPFPNPIEMRKLK